MVNRQGGAGEGSPGSSPCYKSVVLATALLLLKMMVSGGKCLALG